VVSLHFERSAFRRLIVDDRRSLRGLDDGVIPFFTFSAQREARTCSYLYKLTL
jgi:hypothetical protein